MHRRLASHLLVALFAIALTSTPAPALAADEVGKTGAATSIELLTPSADTYLQYHGRLVVMVGTTQEEYRWGGTSCGSRTISDDTLRSLVVAVREAGTITPRFQLGQGTARCLVGFTVD
jgi:hypothetical protein